MGKDKAQLEYLGRPFIDHVIGTMSIAFADVVIAGGSYTGAAPVLPDAVPGIGPLGGLLSAIRHADGRPVLVCPTDMPLVTVDLFTRLADPMVGSRSVRIATAPDGSTQPLCAVYGAGLEPLLTDYVGSGGRSVHGLLDLCAVELVEADAHTLTNVNTPQDLATLDPWGTA
jgi:molybdopterin-guanine dinucleotide biosynthesis protein A